MEIVKPHLVCVPYPTQSHISCMVKLAKLLHHRGFHTTFVNTEQNHARILKARGPHSLDGLPDFQFQTIPDGLPPSDAKDIAKELMFLLGYLSDNGADALSNLLERLNEKSGIPPVTCIISDGFVAFPVVAAERVGIPVTLLWTVSACSFMGYSQLPALVQKGLIPFKDESYLSNGFQDTVIDWIPGKKDFIRLKDLPLFVRTRDPHDFSLNIHMEAVERSRKASAHIFHTFEALERDVLDALTPVLPCLFAIGPLESLLTQKSEEDWSKSIGSNLRKDDLVCLEWLDDKEPGSVLYVNFGSIAQVTGQQLIEIGWGLANSHCNFLWGIRPDLVTGDSAYLPPEFEVELKERGLITSWCPQDQVLNHPSVGGFFTHCGWTSLLESLSAGVPMICWPFFGDQPMNCRYICSEWKAGMEMNGDDVRREKVETLVKEVMGGDERVTLKMKTMEWRKLAEEATTGPYGSSCSAFDNLVNKLKSLSGGVYSSAK